MYKQELLDEERNMFPLSPRPSSQFLFLIFPDTSVQTLSTVWAKLKPSIKIIYHFFFNLHSAIYIILYCYVSTGYHYRPRVWINDLIVLLEHADTLPR